MLLLLGSLLLRLHLLSWLNLLPWLRLLTLLHLLPWLRPFLLLHLLLPALLFLNPLLLHLLLLELLLLLLPLLQLRRGLQFLPLLDLRRQSFVIAPKCIGVGAALRLPGISAFLLLKSLLLPLVSRPCHWRGLPFDSQGASRGEILRASLIIFEVRGAVGLGRVLVPCLK